MDPAKYEFQSEFARRHIALGKAEGRAEGEAMGEARGKAEILLRQLARRFGPLLADVRARLDSASPEQLDQWAERFVDATTLDDVFTDR